MTTDEPKLIVAVYLRGEHLDPEMVTRSICILPSRTQKKGQTYITEAGREFTGKLGLWALAVEFDSPSLDAHLSQLADSLPDRLSFSTISGVEEAYIDVFVALVSDADGDAKCELDVSAKTLDRLAKFGLPVRISMTAGRE